MMEESMEKAPKTLGTMLDYLGLDASVKSEERNGNIVLTVFSDDAGRIIGRKGIALQSLQLLLNRVISKGNRDCPRIMIDVDGYRKPERRYGDQEGGDRSSDRQDRRGGYDREKRSAGSADREDRSAGSADREEQIRKKALDAAKEVKRWGEAVTLPPMNGKDRRIIHLTLEEDNDLITESFTPEDEKGNYKSIVVSVKQ
jgi:spoIIIJ-associated protein